MRVYVAMAWDDNDPAKHSVLGVSTSLYGAWSLVNEHDRDAWDDTPDSAARAFDPMPWVDAWWRETRGYDERVIRGVKRETTQVGYRIEEHEVMP